MNMLNRLAVLEKRLGAKNKANVILIGWIRDKPISRASHGDIVYEIKQNENEAEFQERIVKEASAIPYSGYLWVS